MGRQASEGRTIGEAASRPPVTGAQSDSSSPRANPLLSRRVVSGLCRLQVLIAALPRQQRHSVLQQLSPKLRSVLLSHMESQCHAKATGMARPCPMHSRGAPSRRQQRGKLSQKVAKVQRLPPSGNVCVYRTPWGLRYNARITVGGIAISSTLTWKREEAECLRQKLVQLRESIDSCPADDTSGEFDACFCKAVQGLLDRIAGTMDGDGGCHDKPQSPRIASLRFRATADARQWVGRTISSPQSPSHLKALEARRVLLEARKEGWAALRAEWLRCMQAQRCSHRFGHKALSADSAEAYADVLERSAPLSEWRRKRMTRMSGSAALKTAKEAAALKAAAAREARAARAAAVAERRRRREDERQQRAQRCLTALVARLDAWLEAATAAMRRRKASKAQLPCSGRQRRRF